MLLPCWVPAKLARILHSSRWESCNIRADFLMRFYPSNDPLIGEASSGQFGVDFDGVSLSPGFVCLSSRFFAFDGDGVNCASLPSLAVMSLSRMTGVRQTRPRYVRNSLAKRKVVVVRDTAFVAPVALHSGRRCARAPLLLTHEILRVGRARTGPKQYRFGPASVDSYFRRFSLCVQVSCFLPFLLAPSSTTHLLYLRFHSK